MPVLSVTDLTISFSGPPIIQNAQLHVEPGERICVVGRNGEGKSTLLKAISGEISADSGAVRFPQGGCARSLPQEIPQDLGGSIMEIIAKGFGHEGESLLAAINGNAATDLDPDRQWQIEQRIDRLLEETGLAGDADFASLSGGMKRRALLAQAIAPEPAVLLLDEPTNHLDIPSIRWLESFLEGNSITTIFVTHDRGFLKNIATRIVEIEFATLTSYNCPYETFLVRREQLIESMEKQRRAFEKRLSEEEAWIRKGIKARRTRNEGRVRALQRMREERKSWRSRQGKASANIQSQGASGRKVITAEDAALAIDGEPILEPFSLEIMRGDRIGIVGKNGYGKTSLIRLLLGSAQPTSGTIERGTKLQVAYFDQMRAQLDESQSAFDSIADGNETVMIGGQRKHVITYLKDFLFTSDRARTPVQLLSGGERNRLLLAKLLTQPANLLVLDEPTNDLDLETLEVLEEILIEFDGTLLIVSHDRAFLENTVTTLAIFDKPRAFQVFLGGYEDWERNVASAATPSNTSKKRDGWKDRPQRFTNKQRKELEETAALIEKLEDEKARLVELISDPEIYSSDIEKAKTANERLARIDSEIETAYNRWGELETLRESLT